MAVQYLWTGVPTTDGVSCSVKLAASATSIRMAVSTSPALTSPVYSSSAVPDSTWFIAKLSISGLSPGSYYYGIEIDGVLDTATVGKFTTLPTGSSYSTRILLTTCDNLLSDGAVTAMLALSPAPLFSLMTGDMNYADVSDVNAGALTENHYHVAADSTFAANGRHQLYREIPQAYMWDDHDFGGNDISGRDASNVIRFHTPIALGWFRRRAPVIPASATSTDAVNYSFVLGRIRFIIIDDRTYKTQQQATDNSSKTMLGATQKQWVKDEILAAKNAGQCVALMSGVPWGGTSWVSGEQHWNGYMTERTELSDYIKTQSMVDKVFILSGDMHQSGIAYALDFATGGGCPITNFSIGPVAGVPTNQKGDYEQLFPINRANLTYNHYGTIDIDDDGTYLRLQFRVWDLNGTLHGAYTIWPFGQPTLTVWASLSGGTETTPGDGWKYYTFTSSADLVASSGGKAEYLLGGGGGPGGTTGNTTSYGAGGGAGGIRASSLEGGATLKLPAGTHKVTVGDAGFGATTVDNSRNGGDSSVGAFIVASGGGKGGSQSTNPFPGGSGGGGGGATGASKTGGVAANIGQSFKGGDGLTHASTPAAGGGGGSSTVGADAQAAIGGDGGTGVTIWGNTIGGGGGGSGSTIQGTGQAGGGGGYKNTNFQSIADAAVNSCSGGGGAGASNGRRGGHGGTGLVILRIPVDVTAPGITVRTTIRLKPKTALSLTLTADESVTWTKTGGADQALFTLAGSTLSLSAQGPRVSRVVQVTATDGAGNATNTNITVVTTDYKRRSRSL